MPVRFSLLVFFLFSLLSYAESDHRTTDPDREEEVMIDFKEVSMLELIRFVGKIAKVNCVYDERMLDFPVDFTTGKPIHPKIVLRIMIEMLAKRGIKVEERDEYLLFGREDGYEGDSAMSFAPDLPGEDSEKRVTFQTYKLKYHHGAEIQETIRKIATDLSDRKESDPELLRTINSVRYVPSTNSLIYNGSRGGIASLTRLIRNIDAPKKQIFIEILVIETDVRKALDFGLDWGGGGQYEGKCGVGFGNFSGSTKSNTFASALRSIGSSPPKGAGSFPLTKGFDLGIIGTIIRHKGASYLSLGSLVSALEEDSRSDIILNQKIITQDNQPSHIFVGENIPFTGSVVRNQGSNTLTNTNLEYKDIGVTLDITPLLGDNDIITLDLTQEITEAIDQNRGEDHAGVRGIRTTKTKMSTRAHVPDKSFLVLSGVSRHTKSKGRRGIPCLGGIPGISVVFSKNDTERTKRNIVVFVRPQIVRTADDHGALTTRQEERAGGQSEESRFVRESIREAKHT
ncbi:MAG: hypothetical protein OXF02_04785 [Simkaniaceae bacterium]|nr:hypothetical protein [Simkaniaceae bacterium]